MSKRADIQQVPFPVRHDSLRIYVFVGQMIELTIDGPTTIADVLVQLIRGGRNGPIAQQAKATIRGRPGGPPSAFYVNRFPSCCTFGTPAAQYRETTVKNGDTLSFCDAYLFHYGRCPQDAIENDEILDWLEMSHRDAWERYP